MEEESAHASFLFQFQSIADTIFLGFDQAMQSGQVSNFSQFTSTMIRWVEDSCRPSVYPCLEQRERPKQGVSLLSRSSTKSFVKLLTSVNRDPQCVVYFIVTSLVLPQLTSLQRCFSLLCTFVVSIVSIVFVSSSPVLDGLYIF